MVDFKFEELVVYKKATNFADRIYSLTDNYPKDEVFGLAGQLRRAAVSISLNIAEGSARTKRDFSRFIDMARGSVYECVAILQISLSRNYISESAFGELKEYLAEISKMLSGLKYSLTKLPANTISEPLTANTELRTMNYELRTGKAFTLLELVVAVALLALILSFSGVIFKVSITAQRTAAANAEIMQKFRAITDQLNSDFKGLRKDAPLLIWFRQDPNDLGQRYDQIMFFADGDFQSTQLYNGNPLVPFPTGTPIRGNVARIYYGQARSLDPFDNTIKYPFDIGFIRVPDKRYRVLARRQHILTADPGFANFPVDNLGNFTPFVPANNDSYEHDKFSLSQWKIVDRNVYDAAIVNTCFDTPPIVDRSNAGAIAQSVHNLMAEGVSSFTIQWAYYEIGNPADPRDDRWMWFPGDNITDAFGTYSHFDMVVVDGIPLVPGTGRGYADFKVFGGLFNIHNQSQINYWAPPDMLRYNPNPTSKFPVGFFPAALKFTFTLYDSRGVITDGRRFTHIIYID